MNADPTVGGRYSALTAFGLVPSGLAGADIDRLLDEADAVSDLLADDDEGNPGLRLGAAMAATEPLRDKLVIVDEGSGLHGFADWAEQLIAESTGKQGTGIPPVVVADTSAPEVALPPHDVTVARLVSDADVDDEGTPRPAAPTCRSPARSAPSCCSGRWPPRWPAGSSASTPTTSPTWRARRSRPAPCWRAPRRPRPRTSPTVPSRCAPWAATGWTAPPTWARRSRRCSGSSTGTPGTSR